jgi:hypothetical protein
MEVLQDLTPVANHAAAWVAIDRWPDPLTYEKFAADILRLSGAHTGEERAIAVYRWVNRVFRWGPPYHEWSSLGWVNCDDLTKILAVNGCHFCDGWGRVSSAIWNAGRMGAPSEKLVVWVASGIPGHTMNEFIYEDTDGIERGHAFDIFHQVSSKTRDGKRFAAWDEVLVKDKTLWETPTQPLEPFYYRPSQREAKHNTKYSTASYGLLVPPEHDLRHRLRPGTSIVRYFDPRHEPYHAHPKDARPLYSGCHALHDPESAYNDDGSPRDPANEPYFRAYLKKCTEPGCAMNGKPVRFYASGEHIVRPPLTTTAALQASSSHRLLHAKAEKGRMLEAKKRQLACYILPVECPYILTEGTLTFKYAKKDARDWVAVQASPDGRLRMAQAWCSPKEARNTPEKVAVELNLKEFLNQKPSVYGRYAIYFRFELLSHGEPGSCWFEDIEFRGAFMHNCMVSPILQPGRNRFVLTGGNAGLPVKLDMAWEESGRARNYEATSDTDMVSDTIICGAEEPCDIRMVSIGLSAGS